MKLNPSRWRTISCETIDKVVQSAPVGSDLIKLIDASYPFCTRKYTPYKVWLEERKKALIRLNLYKVKVQVQDNRKCKYHSNGQTCLICMNLPKD